MRGNRSCGGGMYVGQIDPVVDDLMWEEIVL